MALTERYVTSDAGGGGDGSIGDPWTLSEAIAGCAAGDRVNILSGTYTRTASDRIETSGTVGSPIIFRGVTSFSPLTPIVPTRTNGGALVTTGMPVIAYDAGFNCTPSGAYIFMYGLSFSGSINNRLLYLGSAASQSNLLCGCVVTNASSLGSARCIETLDYPFSVIDCDLSLTGGGTNNNSAIYAPGGCQIIGCRITNNSTGALSSGVSIRYGTTVATNQIFGCAIGIYHVNTGGRVVISGNTIYGCSVAAVNTINAAAIIPYCATNNLFVNNAYALYNPYNATAAHPLVSVNNCYYNNTNPNLGFGDWPEQGRIDLASDPFVDAAAGDFRLKPGSLARNAGLGGVDCGAIQHVDPTQPATTTVWFGTSYNDGLSTGEMRASDIANCEAGNIKKDVVIDDVTGIYEAEADPDTVITAAGGNYVEPQADELLAGVVAGAGAYEVVGTLTVPSTPTYPSLVAATSFLSLPKHLLREMIARSSTFQTLIGAGGTEAQMITQARAKIHLTAMHDFETWSAPRPFFLITGPMPAEARHDNGYTGADSGTLKTYFEMAIPTEYTGDDEQDVTDAETYLLNIYGAIIMEVLELCGTDYDATRTYPYFQTAPMQYAPMRSDKRQGEGGEYWQIIQEWNYGNNE